MAAELPYPCHRFSAYSGGRQRIHEVTNLCRAAQPVHTQVRAELGHTGFDARQSSNLSDTDAFVLTRAIAGALRAALMKNPRLLKQRDFEEALVAMIVLANIGIV